MTVETEANENATVVKVYSANRHGILLNVVQVLTDLDLTITKSDIFHDLGWFMDGQFLRSLCVLFLEVFDSFLQDSSS